jgi:hypothetical protein
MAKREIKVRKRNYARPTRVATATATTTADSTLVSIGYTLPAIPVGPPASSYVVTGTSNTGTAVNTVITTSGTSMEFSPGQTYNVTVAPQNHNGVGEALTASAALVIPSTYQLATIANATTTYTVPVWATKLAAYAVGAGGGGGAGGGAGGNNGNQAYGGSGAGAGGIAGFKDFTVTSGQVITLNIGSAGTGGVGVSGGTGGNGNAGGATTIVAAGTTIATANGGNGGNGNNAAGTNFNGTDTLGAGNGGSGSSNVAGAVTFSGASGGNGWLYFASPNQSPGSLTGGTNVAGTNILQISPGSSSGYGGGGSGGTSETSEGSQAAGGSGGGGAAGIYNPGTNAGLVGGAGVRGGGGAGGTGRRFINNSIGNAGGTGGAGSAGVVVLYVSP